MDRIVRVNGMEESRLCCVQRANPQRALAVFKLTARFEREQVRIYFPKISIHARCRASFPCGFALSRKARRFGSSSRKIPCLNGRLESRGPGETAACTQETDDSDRRYTDNKRSLRPPRVRCFPQS